MGGQRSAARSCGTRLGSSRPESDREVPAVERPNRQPDQHHDDGNQHQELPTDATIERELAHYEARVAAERESQTMPDDHTADAARLGAPDVRMRSGGAPN